MSFAIAQQATGNLISFSIRNFWVVSFTWRNNFCVLYDLSIRNIFVLSHFYSSGCCRCCRRVEDDLYRFR